MKKSRNDDIVLLSIIALIAGVYCLLMLYIGEDSHLCINDNLDSNIPIFKMIKDKGLFWNYSESIPFLHGDIQRKEYPVLLSATAWIYMAFDSFHAYVTIRVMAFVMSAVGFWMMGKQVDVSSTHIWVLCGIIYGVLGTWPHAAIAFASIPVWVACYSILYFRRNKIVFLILPWFVVLMNFALVGMWVLAYTTIIVGAIVVKKHRIDMLIAWLESTIFFWLRNGFQIRQNVNNNETIKSIVVSRYTDSIKDSLHQIPGVFLFDHFYHCGGGGAEVFGNANLYLLYAICSLPCVSEKKEGETV